MKKMKKIPTLVKRVFRKLTPQEEEFLNHLKKCCEEEGIVWLYWMVKTKIKGCCTNNHLDIMIEADDGDWGDEVFDVRYSLEKRYGKFSKAEMHFKNELDWNKKKPYERNPLIIHWVVDL